MSPEPSHHAKDAADAILEWLPDVPEPTKAMIQMRIAQAVAEQSTISDFICTHHTDAERERLGAIHCPICLSCELAKQEVEIDRLDVMLHQVKIGCPNLKVAIALWQRETHNPESTPSLDVLLRWLMTSMETPRIREIEAEAQRKAQAYGVEMKRFSELIKVVQTVPHWTINGGCWPTCWRCAIDRILEGKQFPTGNPAAPMPGEQGAR